jgi:hypothetical protein
MQNFTFAALNIYFFVLKSARECEIVHNFRQRQYKFDLNGEFCGACLLSILKLYVKWIMKNLTV